MSKLDYKERLRAFNSTDKYQDEKRLLTQIMDLRVGEKVLDYGCGLGQLVWDMVEWGVDAYGYDYVNYRDQDDQFRFRQEYTFKFDKVLFMHSISHIPNIEERLEYLREYLNPGASVYVITPNQKWIDSVKNPNYIPDPTVISHFTLADLVSLFEGAGFVVDLFGQFGERKAGECERLILKASVK